MHSAYEVQFCSDLISTFKDTVLDVRSCFRGDNVVF
jgi:hypothetical protein